MNASDILALSLFGHQPRQISRTSRHSTLPCATRFQLRILRSRLICMYRLHRRGLGSLTCRCLVRFTSTMPSSIFRIQEHAIPTCHIREYPRALADDENDQLLLAVKQYTPKEGPGSSENGVTIIGAHANGFPKVRSKVGPYESNTYSRVNRSCTNHYGTICMNDSNLKAFTFEIFLFQTSHTKENLVS